MKIVMFMLVLAMMDKIKNGDDISTISLIFDDQGALIASSQEIIHPSLLQKWVSLSMTHKEARLDMLNLKMVGLLRC